MIETLLAENNVRAQCGGEKVIISVLQHRTYLRPARVNRKKRRLDFYLSEPFHPEHSRVSTSVPAPEK